MAAIIGLIVSAVSCVICIIGMAIPYWVQHDLVDSHAGLWSACIGSTCHDWVLVTSSMKAVRAFELIGVLMTGAAVLLALLKLICLKEKAILYKLAGILAIVAGVLMILGAVIFAAKTKKDSFSGWDLHAGFALCIISGVGCIVGGVLFLISRNEVHVIH